MPKQIPKEELKQIIQRVALYSNGVTAAELFTVLDSNYTKRTLQRRLNKLVETQELISTGVRKSRRYTVKQLGEEASQVNNFQNRPLIQLSEKADEVRELIERPHALRSPVSYQDEFLDSYEPNERFYLSPAIRQYCLKIGKTEENIQPAGTFAKKLYERLLIDLTWNSSRLEGNTYSLLETERLIHEGQPAQGKDAQETQMILNHKTAIDLLVDSADDIGFNRYTICNLHALLAENLLPDTAAGGRLRQIPIGIGGSVYSPMDNTTRLETTFQKLLTIVSRIKNPFEQAFFIMVHQPYLQPFEDVNKRVSRLAANIPLIRQNLCPLSFVDVPQKSYVDALIGIYELNRVEYLRDVFVWAYERSCSRYVAIRQSIGDPDPFRLAYRNEIQKLIRTVVQGGLIKSEAISQIGTLAEQISKADRPRFIEVVETELNGLHEGNIARYRLSVLEFKTWQTNW